MRSGVSLSRRVLVVRGEARFNESEWRNADVVAVNRVKGIRACQSFVSSSTRGRSGQIITHREESRGGQLGSGGRAGRSTVRSRKRI